MLIPKTLLKHRITLYKATEEIDAEGNRFATYTSAGEAPCLIQELRREQRIMLGLDVARGIFHVFFNFADLPTAVAAGDRLYWHEKDINLRVLEAIDEAGLGLVQRCLAEQEPA